MGEDVPMSVRSMKVKVLFVCYGNICRSPIAEFVFRDMVESAGLSDRICCESCATSGEHIGDPVDRRSRDVLSRHGIDCSGKRGRRLTRSDMTRFDYVIGMDDMNLRYIRTLQPSDDCCRTGLVLDHAGGGEVADPYYTGDFDRAYSEISRGCRALLDHIMENDLGM